MSEPRSDDDVGYEEEEDEEDEEEEDEPILKFSRMADLNELKVILDNDAISCVAVHSRFICVGTYFGNVRLLDHQGNEIITSPDGRRSTFPTHLVSVNQISVDQKGEYIATCSSDGTLNVFGLYNNDLIHKLSLGQPVNTVALDPTETASSTALGVSSAAARRFIAGDASLQLYERTIFKNLRTTMLHAAEGYVSAICWSGQFVAWASGVGVRVYDLHERCSLGLIRWEEPPAAEGRITDYRCNLRWANAQTLLIGWVDTIRICVIRKRNAVVAFSGGGADPTFIVDPVATFQTDFIVCGLAPLVAGDQIVVLGQLKERDERTGKAQRPIVCVMQYTASTYLPICTSSITMRGFEEYAPKDYHLECLRDEHMYFIVAPKDLIVASLCETDDRIQWLINHRKFDEALAAISEHGGRYSQVSVARLYLDHLLDADQFESAASVCRRWFGTDKALWEEEVYKFVNRKQLRCIKAYLPRSEECKLSPHIYEMVLYEYLKSDTAGFRELIFEWPPTLYNTTVVINAIKEHLRPVAGAITKAPPTTAATGESAMLFEALAFLYTKEGRYEAALDTYLWLKHREVFNLIRKHVLYDHIEKKIVALFKLDEKRAIDLLLDKDKVDPDVVVEQLDGEPNKKYLFRYLEALDKVDRSGRYHSRLIELYATFDRDLLLPFLRRAQNYNIETVINMCRRLDFYKELVYVLGCVGNNAEALHVYLHQMKDFGGALEFCKRNDDIDLWTKLIAFALAADQADDAARVLHESRVTQLMDGIVGFLEPRVLVEHIGGEVRVPRLRDALVRMLSDASLQTAIQEKCNDILMTDYFGLHQRVLVSERRAVGVAVDNVCGRCGHALLAKDAVQMRDIVAFNCRHMFHAVPCHADAAEQNQSDGCSICKSKHDGQAVGHQAGGGTTAET